METITNVVLVLAGWPEIFMSLFLVRSEKTREINGIRETESNPIIKAHSSKIPSLYRVETLSSWSVIKPVIDWGLIGFSLHGHRMDAGLLPASSPQ